MRHGILNRVLKLEHAAPAPGDNVAFRERLERARARVDASLSHEERAQRLSPDYLAQKAKRQALYDARMAKIRAAGRKPTIAETLNSGRELLP